MRHSTSGLRAHVVVPPVLRSGTASPAGVRLTTDHPDVDVTLGRITSRAVTAVVARITVQDGLERMLGVPLQDEPRFHAWADAIVEGIGPRASVTDEARRRAGPPSPRWGGTSTPCSMPTSRCPART